MLYKRWNKYIATFMGVGMLISLYFKEPKPRGAFFRSLQYVFTEFQTSTSFGTPFHSFCTLFYTIQLGSEAVYTISIQMVDCLCTMWKKHNKKLSIWLLLWLEKGHYAYWFECNDFWSQQGKSRVLDTIPEVMSHTQHCTVNLGTYAATEFKQQKMSFETWCKSSF